MAGFFLSRPVSGSLGAPGVGVAPRSDRITHPWTFRLPNPRSLGLAALALSHWPAWFRSGESRGQRSRGFRPRRQTAEPLTPHLVAPPHAGPLMKQLITSRGRLAVCSLA